MKVPANARTPTENSLEQEKPYISENLLAKICIKQQQKQSAEVQI